MLGASTLRNMVTAARGLRNGDWALELHSLAARDGKGSPRMCAAVVRTLATAGRLEEAAAIMKVTLRPHECPGTVEFCFVLPLVIRRFASCIPFSVSRLLSLGSS